MAAAVLAVAVFFLQISFPAAAESYRIAILADPHIMDVEKHPELVKSMEDEVCSTRLFNENIFAFRAVLDDIAGKDIKLVIIDGDITDDGQLLNQEAARKILRSYEKKYGMRFFLTPGNHDPKVPFGRDVSYSTFLQKDGSTHTIASRKEKPGDIVNKKLWSAGHREQLKCYCEFGYTKQKDYLYWDAPLLPSREFSYGEGTPADIDMSYVVEPVKGLWLLSIDSGAYPPDGKGSYKNSGDGYNNTLQYKPYILPWVRKVAREADEQGKVLVAFSHFPLVDFNCGASPIISELLGKDKFDLGRIPSKAVADSMTDAGIRLHFAGHMHINNRAVNEFNGKALTNVQIPTVAVGVPSYLILDVDTDSLDDPYKKLETVRLGEVKGFDRLFPLYRKEIEYEKQPVWDISILESKTYAEFCDKHLQNLVRLRFCTRDIPKALQENFISKTGNELLASLGSTVKVGDWTGYDVILDLYRFHYCGPEAWTLVTKERVEEYNTLFEAAQDCGKDTDITRQIIALGKIFNCFIQY